MNRKMNFFAGPSVLPLEVLKELEAQMVDYQGNGFSMIEASHRGKVFEGMYEEARSLFRELLGIPENYSVYFLGGGATLQFAMIPMNFLRPGMTADYVKSGTWSNKSYEDACKIGAARAIFDGKASNYTTLPDPRGLQVPKDSAYLYLCSNETIGGIAWKDWPETGDVPLVADMSSDILSRPVPVEKFAMIYGGVQKNLGPAGATFIIIRDDMLQKCPDSLPNYFNYRLHAENDGLYNTPPVFSIWGVKLVLDWIKRMGGVDAMSMRAGRKSAILYDVITGCGDFYRSPVDPEYRSRMNIVFRLKSEELEGRFLKEASAMGMLGLKGHRSVGGCRASIYNALPEEDVIVLAEFMKEFARKNG